MKSSIGLSLFIKDYGNCLCENDGDCNISEDPYTCSCPDGYDGRYCENGMFFNTQK